MANVEIKGEARITPFRKIALGTWQDAYDPSIYGTLRLRMEPSLEYIERFRAKHGKKLTLTHLVCKAVGIALKECPEANSLLRFNRIYQRKHVDLSVLVLMEDEGKKDLSAAKIDRIDEKSLLEIVTELEERAAKIRARKDAALENTRRSMGRMPNFLMNLLLKLIAFFAYTLNLNMKWAGIPKDPFGGAVVTSIGSIGLDIGYVPLVPYTRVPIFVAPGRLEEAAVVQDGEVVPGHMMNINATFDHRIIDGAHAAELASTLRRVFADPFGNFDPLD